MFAFALWDSKERRLWLARDRYGIKPLYYGTGADGGLVFGSEPKAPLAAGLKDPALDWTALLEYFQYGAPLGELSMWRGLRHLLPGHLLTAGPDGGVKIKEYAAIGPAERVDLSRKDAAARLRELLDRSVAAHMTSDVPVGAFLSGGLDSSALCAAATPLAQGRLTTWAAGFDRSRRGGRTPGGLDGGPPSGRRPP